MCHRRTIDMKMDTYNITLIQHGVIAFYGEKVKSPPHTPNDNYSLQF